MRSGSALVLVLFVLVGVATACSDQERAPPPAHPPGTLAERCKGAGKTVAVEDQPAPEASCEGQPDGISCLGEWAVRCENEELAAIDNCAIEDAVCVAQSCRGKTCDGCRVCRADDVQCGADGALLRCMEDGSGFEQTETCDEAAGEVCSLASGKCEDLCAAAQSSGTYVGCEYWAVPTRNSQLTLLEEEADGVCRPFSFAIVISNPQGVAAEVDVDVAGGATRHVRVPPQGVKTVELPCEPALKGAFGFDDHSVHTPGVAAHHVRSNVPVTVYQFNPLEFQSEDPEGDSIYSHTNDASLLLPVHSMTGNYVVMALPTLANQRIFSEPDLDAGELDELQHGPGFVALVGVEDTPTEVTITSSAYTLPSADGVIPALRPGQELTLTLERGQVIELLSATPETCDWDHADVARGDEIRYCKVGRAYDLTGTRIAASGKLSVVAGHDCAFLPYDRWACDHVEETLLPLEAWGKTVAISVSEAIRCQPTVPNMVRVLSATDGNRVRFTPALIDPITLDAGEHFDFEITEDVQVSAQDAVLVGQFLLGQDYQGIGSAGSRAKGDPSMSIAIPLEQWRKDYAFLTPETFTDNYVNLIAQKGQVVTLDDELVQGFTTIEGTETTVARVPVEGGVHRARSPGGFGLVLYGYAYYTSYMLPGGTDLNLINGPD